MRDADCVDFLQWALPQLRMRWPGFRKVRGQVCKRIAQRVGQLGLPGIEAYRGWLAAHPQEWSELDRLCRVTITRFYRDRQVFGTLAGQILPQLAMDAKTEGRETLRGWSIGCASGEEPYTLAILWRGLLASEFPGLRLEVLATDADPRLIERAHRACYPPSTLKNLPDTLLSDAFIHSGEDLCLKQAFHRAVNFQLQDIRHTLPAGPFHLILCRNLVFTYFDEALQRQILQQLHAKLLPAGWLILGVHEKLPSGQHGFAVVSERMGLYRRA
jgi:chemotaxis protein methyltransferase CheR